MPVPNRNNKTSIDKTEQGILNRSFDEDYQVLAFLPLSIDGTNAKIPVSDLVATKITEDGADTYIAIAAVGTAQATAKWQVKKISVSGADTLITWADGNSNFDNVASDLTILSYS